MPFDALGTILALGAIGAITRRTTTLKHAGHSGTSWMSRAEVARVLQVAPVTIGRWASQGKLPYAVTLGGRRRFRREDILLVQKTLSEASVPPLAQKSRRRR